MNDAITNLHKTTEKGLWGYYAEGPQSSEPAALACLALNAYGLHDAALPLAKWLSEIQSPQGSVGVTQEQDTPAWPTSLAILAWRACDAPNHSMQFQTSIQKALDWSLDTFGSATEPTDQVGHDTTILGWSWAADTHSWIEPTCMFVLALKAIGQSQHVRTRDGVRLITDRLHETGGCNYGNTIVLGQSTMAHVQSTGLALLALADEDSTDPRLERSIEYLLRELEKNNGTASLSYALLGLTAQQRRPQNAGELLQRAYTRELERGTNCYKLALLALAELSNSAWLPHLTSLTPAELATK